MPALGFRLTGVPVPSDKFLNRPNANVASLSHASRPASLEKISCCPERVKNNLEWPLTVTRKTTNRRSAWLSRFFNNTGFFRPSFVS